jgi:hypothetical protein
MVISIYAYHPIPILHTYFNNIIISVVCTCLFILPQNYNAKVSKFGWAKLGFHSTVHIDRGYAAPEYLEKGNDISKQMLEI